MVSQRVWVAALAHLLLAGLTFALWTALESVWPMHDWTPWLTVENPHVCSGALGLALGGMAVALTHVLARTTEWARALTRELAPNYEGASTLALGAWALASGLGEELLFRGVLTLRCGVLLAGIAFGLGHLRRGAPFLAWALCATTFGWVLGALFLTFGSLMGPVVAHVTINGANVLRLRGRGRSEARVAPPRLVGSAQRTLTRSR